MIAGFNLPDVTENNRDIPRGKVAIEKSPPADEPRAIPIVLDSRRAWGGTKVELIATPAGWACAGSVIRWDNGSYGIRYEHYGQRHRRAFRTADEALDLFKKLPE